MIGAFKGAAAKLVLEQLGGFLHVQLEGDVNFLGNTTLNTSVLSQ